MADRRHLANDAWEALLSAHAVLMKQFAAEDIWQDVSMREYDVLYTLSKCPGPQRLGDHARSVARALTAGLGPGELRQLEAICLQLARHDEKGVPRP